MRDIKMLKIRSINAACYLSYTTRIEAEVVTNDDGLNHYEFPRVPMIMASYDKYRKTTEAQKELMVDLTQFNKYIRKYKSKTKTSK